MAPTSNDIVLFMTCTCIQFLSKTNLRNAFWCNILCTCLEVKMVCYRSGLVSIHHPLCKYMHLVQLMCIMGVLYWIVNFGIKPTNLFSMENVFGEILQALPHIPWMAPRMNISKVHLLIIQRDSTKRELIVDIMVVVRGINLHLWPLTRL
jgi:hypothetical protein